MLSMRVQYFCSDGKASRFDSTPAWILKMYNEQRSVMECMLSSAYIPVCDILMIYIFVCVCAVMVDTHE